MTTTASSPAPVDWFEIGSPDPAGAQEFYGELLGWTFLPDGAGPGYTIVQPGADAPHGGGIFATEGSIAPYAVFTARVSDVTDTCRRAEELGGKVLVAPASTDNGLQFAHLLDRDGNHFGIYSPAG